MRCNENLPRSLGVPCNIRRAFPNSWHATGRPERRARPLSSSLRISPSTRTLDHGATGGWREVRRLAAAVFTVGDPALYRISLVLSDSVCRLRHQRRSFQVVQRPQLVTSKSCVFDQHSLFLQLIGDVVDQSGGPEMFNPRNCHVLSLRIEFAAAGACLRSMRTAAGTAPSRFGMALSGVATPIHDPGGGPGG